MKTTIMVLVGLVVVGLIALPGLRQAMERLHNAPKTDEQARREVMQAPISTPTDVSVRAQMYWLSASSPNTLEATTIQLPLSADPVERSKQLLIALIARVPDPKLRTLPAEASLLAFYLQPDGTAIADFSDEISSAMPSGILSEQLAVQSIAQTLGANVGGIRQLKILVHGQEAETLAGHLDLYGMFPVASTSAEGGTTTAPVTAPATTPPSGTAKQGTAATPAGAGGSAPAKPGAAAAAPGKPTSH
jgi:hypothetical protein